MIKKEISEEFQEEATKERGKKFSEGGRNEGLE